MLNVFVQIVKCICSNCQMYLFKLSNVFVPIVKCICSSHPLPCHWGVLSSAKWFLLLFFSRFFSVFTFSIFFPNVVLFANWGKTMPSNGFLLLFQHSLAFSNFHSKWTIKSPKKSQGVDLWWGQYGEDCCFWWWEDLSNCLQLSRAKDDQRRYQGGGALVPSPEKKISNDLSRSRAGLLKLNIFCVLAFSVCRSWTCLTVVHLVFNFQFIPKSCHHAIGSFQ